MEFKEIIESNDEIKKLVTAYRNIDREENLSEEQLDHAKEKVGWKDKLNVFTTSHEEKEVKKIKIELSEKRREMQEILQNIVKLTLLEKVKLEPNFIFEVMLRVMKNIKDKTNKIEATVVTQVSGGTERHKAVVENKQELISYINNILNATRDITAGEFIMASNDFIELGYEIKNLVDLDN